MKPKSLVIFAGVTAVVTAVALVTVANRYWISQSTATERAFPGLLDRINDVAEIDVKAKGTTTVIKRADPGWVMSGKYDYPVQTDMANRAAIGFGEMEFTERKTTHPDRYARLGVEDVDGENAKSRLVTLKDAKGTTLAELIVGRPREGRLGGQGGIYVRHVGDAQSWFAPANFEIPGNPMVWLEPRIIHVNAKRVAQVTTVQPNGDALVLYKDTPQTAHFAFKDLPPGKKLKGEAVADDMSTALTTIDLVDVAPQANIDFSQKVWHTDVKTFDGLDVKVDIVQQGEHPWAKLSASAGTPLTDRSSQPEDVQKFLKTAEQVSQEAADLNGRTGKWAYELQGYQAEKLRSPLSIFLEAEQMGQGPGDLGGPGGGGPGMGGPGGGGPGMGTPGGGDMGAGFGPGGGGLPPGMTPGMPARTPPVSPPPAGKK